MKKTLVFCAVLTAVALICWTVKLTQYHFATMAALEVLYK